MNRYCFDSVNHVHKLDNRPMYGTSTVVQVLAKPLQWWSAELAAVTCLEVGEKIPTIREEYLEACASPDKKKAIDALQKKYPLFKAARFAHYNDKNKKAEKGIDLHAELERYVKDAMKHNSPLTPTGRKDFNDRIQPFIDWSEKNVKKFLCSEACCYSEKLWTGGIADSMALLNDGSVALIDFKSSKSAYFSQFCQCAGYAIEVAENGLFDKDGNQIPLLWNYQQIDKLIIVPFGADEVVPVYNPLPIADYKEAFTACVSLNKLLGKEEKLQDKNK